MNDNEVRELVRQGFRNGRVQRQIPVIASGATDGPTQVVAEGPSRLSTPCYICGRQPTEMRLTQASIAIHERCLVIWQEETARP